MFFQKIYERQPNTAKLRPRAGDASPACGQSRRVSPCRVSSRARARGPGLRASVLSENRLDSWLPEVAWRSTGAELK